MHGKAMPYAIVSNNISGTHGNLKGSKLVNLSVLCFEFLSTAKLRDNVLGSVCPSACLSVNALKAEPFDL